MRNHDDGDPHDLSFPSKHIPRASMVDNLVMSLDQFSSTNDTSRSHVSSAWTGRHKGHTKSPSAVTATEVKLHLRETPVVEIHPPKDGLPVEEVEQIPGFFTEEEETHRERAYNAQRAMQTSKTATDRGNTRSKSRSNSNASSIDLGHLATYANRLGPAGNRRSQSFDFGSTRPKNMVESPDLGITQAAYRSPEHSHSSGAILSGGTQDVVRRNSGRSARGCHSRKGRSGTVGVSNTRSRLESPQPFLASKTAVFDSAETKSIAPTQNDQSPGPRAGFFRRVFGSSNRSATNSPYPPVSMRLSQDRTGSALDVYRPSTPPSKHQKQAFTDSIHNKENQPVVTKKSSSFFRRRKKSVTSGVPPPMPLTLHGSLDANKAQTGGSSPVSSLRALMDPYLAENASKHARGTSLQSVQNADDGILASVSANADDRARTNRAGPNDSSFLSPKLYSAKANGIATPLTKSLQAGSANSVLSAQNSSPGGRSTAAGPATAFSNRSIETTTPRARVSAYTPAQPDDKGVAIEITDRSHTYGSHSPMTAKLGTNRSGKELPASMKMIKLVPQSSGSDTSDYKSAPSTPLVTEMPDRSVNKSPIPQIVDIQNNHKPSADDTERAQRIYDNTDDTVNSSSASAWLGEAGAERQRVRAAFMSMFDWTSHTILAALRNLCSKLALRGETQQVDRILDSFSKRWCECNVSHGFRSTDVVHTICYSILLLNTDLHMADIGKKMTRAEFVRNAIDTIRENVADSTNAGPASSDYLSVNAPRRPSVERAASSLSTNGPTEHLSREDSHDDVTPNQSGPLVEVPFYGSQGGWELQIEFVLKDFYTSISRKPLPLFGSQAPAKLTSQQSMNSLSAMSNLRRTPSTVSRATSDHRSRYIGESKSLGARWASKARSRPRLATAQGFGSSRTSIDDQSSGWSPSMSSTWSKASLGKTLTSMSVDSFGTEHMGGGYQSSIGFANALSQAIIRDEQMETHTDDGMKAAPLLEDESLELYGAPWAKEGILKHKCHLEGVDKRSKDRNWNDCFAVIEKGWMRLFSFSMTAKSLRNKARNHKAGDVVGGGNWQDNAEEVWKFMLRHTIASSLPPPGYSKQRPYVWALSLPNGAVHLFSVGTPDIVKEFVSTANFWSARLSKEPMTGGITSMEYGWSDNVINRTLVGSESRNGFRSSSPRPSTQMSIRSSIDHSSVRPRLPGDKAHITEWVPPQQSLMASQLLEVDQLKALVVYVQTVEDELQKHNELRGPMLLAFSTRHPNSQRAMSNWEKKSSYLLREIVKFRTYMDALQSAQTTKQKVEKMRKEHELGRKTEIETKEVAVEAA